MEKSQPQFLINNKKVLKWAKSPKSRLWKCIFENMALYFKCWINKNALFDIVFWRFCPL